MCNFRLHWTILGRQLINNLNFNYLLNFKNETRTSRVKNLHRSYLRKARTCTQIYLCSEIELAENVYFTLNVSWSPWSPRL